MTTTIEEKTSALLVRAHGGHRGAFANLLSRVESRVLSMARRRLSRTVRVQVDSQDILQDVLAETVRRFDGCAFRSDVAFWGWLKRVTSNKIGELARRVSLESGLGAIRGQLVDSESQHAQEAPSRRLIQRESFERLESALRSLPRRQELALRLRDIEGLTFEQVADHLGLRSAASARVLRRRGWVSLTRRLERLGYDGWEGE